MMLWSMWWSRRLMSPSPDDLELDCTLGGDDDDTDWMLGAVEG